MQGLFGRGKLLGRSELFNEGCQQPKSMERLETSHVDVICNVSLFFCCFDPFVMCPCQIKQLPSPCKRLIPRGKYEADVPMKYPGLLLNKETSVAQRNL